MFELIIEFYDGRVENHFFDTKEEVETEIDFQWTEEADFLVRAVEYGISIFWEDRFDFGW